MTDLPTIEELIENYENIPQDKLLAWWQAKGVKWNDFIEKESAYSFFLELWQSGPPFEIKLMFLNILPRLDKAQFNELVERLKLDRKKIAAHLQRRSDDIRQFIVQNQLANEKLIHIFNALSPEERDGFSSTLTLIDKIEEKLKNFYARNRQKEATKPLKQKLNIYEQKPFQGLICFDPERAQTYMNLGISLRMTRNYDAAIKSYKQAQEILKGAYCKDRNEFDTDRVRTAMNLGIALDYTRDYDAAIKSFKSAQKILKGNYCIGRDEFDPERIGTALSLGRTLRIIGNYAAAIKSIKQAQELLKKDCFKSRSEFVIDQINAADNLGIALRLNGNYGAAIKSFNCAQKLLKGSYCIGRNEFDPERIRIAINLGNTLQSIRDYDAAIKSFKRAQKILKGSYCKGRDEFDIERAQTAINLGVSLRLSGNYGAAIKSYKQAQEVLKGAYCIDRNEFDPERARIENNLGFALCHTGDYDAAIDSFKEAEQIYESKTMGHWLPLNKERCGLYANTSNLLDKMDKPLVWAKEKSERLIQMLELAPDKEAVTDGTGPIWEDMRQSFARFHLNWLAFVIYKKKYEEIPRILFCIQGRELASEILEELGEETEQHLPDQVKAYLKLRLRLRKMIQKKNGGTTGTIEPFDPDSRSLGRERQDKELEAEQEAIAAYNRLHRKMDDARRKASGLPGYELLELPYGAFTLENIQAIPDFLPHQSLLLMINYEDVQGVLAIQKQGIPKWLPLNGMDELATRTRILTGERNSYLGNCRRNIHDDRQEKKDLPMMTTKERRCFWPDMIRELREKFWSPLQQYLSGKNELIILPQGSLHQLPVLAGKPEGVTTRFYSGLIYYALQTGLIKRNTQEVGRCRHYPAALLYYDHRDNGKKFLAGVQKEVEAIKAVHQKNNSLCETLEYPDPFPNDPIQIDLLTGIGHGGDDPHMVFSTAMQVSRDQSLGYQDILSGKATVRHALFNTCLIAMNRDDSQGTPMGLSSGFFRKGSQSITGFLYPISDLLASHFGPIFHKCWLASETKDPDTVLRKTCQKFMESALDIVVQYWRPILQREVADYTTVRKKVQVELINAFELDEDGAAIIAGLINDYEGPVNELPDLIIKALMDMKSYSSDDDDPPLMAIGTILYGIRVYGR